LGPIGTCYLFSFFNLIIKFDTNPNLTCVKNKFFYNKKVLIVYFLFFNFIFQFSSKWRVFIDNLDVRIFIQGFILSVFFFFNFNPKLDEKFSSTRDFQWAIISTYGLKFRQVLHNSGPTTIFGDHDFGSLETNFLVLEIYFT